MTDDVNKILAERGSTYGDFSDNSAISRVLKDTMSGYAGWGRLTNVQREALDMIAHKISRILAGDPNFKDHWDDIAGYATLVANRCAQQEETKVKITAIQKQQNERLSEIYGQPAPATQSPAEKMLERMDAIRKPKVGEERRCDDDSREMWTGKQWVKSSAAPPPPRDGLKAGDKLHCAQCDNYMRVNAAGYCICGFAGCPNAGKKVM